VLHNIVKGGISLRSEPRLIIEDPLLHESWQSPRLAYFKLNWNLSPRACNLIRMRIFVRLWVYYQVYTKKQRNNMMAYDFVVWDEHTRTT
jgi:hypothetical protein